jgi:DNA-directed RNA polymerase subunit RPC12/RpoP
MSFCFNCGSKANAGADFCVKCGKQLDFDSAVSESSSEVFCQSCGSKLKKSADVCINCGKAAKSRTNKRVVKSQIKSNGVALVLSILIPGAGHLYLGLTEEGTPYLIASAISLFFAFTLIGLPISFLIWLVTMIMTAPKMSALTEEVNAEILG